MVTDYLVPVSVSEALKMLASHKGQARIIAGGTDLVLQMDSGEKSPQILVDITHIDAMKQIELDSEYIYIGAAVTHAEIASLVSCKETR